MPVELALAETSEPFPYQQISVEAERLRRLGLSTGSIARALGVTKPTVSKAIRWAAGLGSARPK